jgi:anti-sigma regulatory factor (Ser/Thr protein kinase)
VGSVEKELGQWGLCDATDLIRVCIAFREALLNAMIHGNLEVSSELKEQGDHQFDEMIARRRGEDPYRQRRVFVRIRQSAQEVEFVIRDEGPGFDPAKLPDPTDPERIAQASGRGLLLIHTFMDDVRHACNGREIVMSKRAGVSRSECGLGITPRE